MTASNVLPLRQASLALILRDARVLLQEQRDSFVECGCVHSRETGEAMLFTMDAATSQAVADFDNMLRRIDVALQSDQSVADRMAALLEEVWEAVLLKLRDTVNGHEVEVRLGSFRPDLSERIAELLEEIGR